MVLTSTAPTPRSLKILLGATFIGAILSPLTFPFLALSLKGVENFYFWQFFTYIFTLRPPLDFSFLLNLGFSLFLIWTFGTSLLERSKPSLIYSLYFASTAFGALFAVLAMKLFSMYFFFTGANPAIYALFIAWVFQNPGSRLLLFFTIPIEAKWLLAGALGANLLLDITSGNWVSCFALLGSTLFSYLFSLSAWRMKGPFPALHPFESAVFRLLETINRVGKRSKTLGKSKIFDIRSGEPVLSDEVFMDHMLARISISGEDSLSSTERKRMEKISKKRMVDK